MKEEQITLRVHEQKRAVVLNRVLAKEWTQQEAGEALGLSERQVRRLQVAYREEGPSGLVHGNRGRQPVHTLSAEVRERVVELARTTYAGCNDQHLSELLEPEGLQLSRPSVRRLLRAAGLPSPRKRQPPKHRSRRERKPQAGMLLQADGSRHRWLGPDGPYLTLIGGMDDATGTVTWALFREQEDAQGYMHWLQHVVSTEGIPLALYVDRHGIFKRNDHQPLTLEEELAGGPLPTQFERVLQELDIEPIYAMSPQAKGRIERVWGTFQDRLVSELRLAGIKSLEAANAFLPGFLERYNARFAVAAARPGSAYRPLPEGFCAEQVFCFKYTRTVASDNTVSFGGHSLQLLADRQRASYAKAQVEVHERLDGSLVVWYQGRAVGTRPAPATPARVRARTGPRVRLPSPSARTLAGKRLHDGQRPAPEHPWKRSYKLSGHAQQTAAPGPNAQE